MATLFENLNTIKQQKLEIKKVLGNMGYDMQNVVFTEYAEKLSAVNDQRVEIVNALSSGGVIDAGTPLNEALSTLNQKIESLVAGKSELETKYGEYALSVESLVAGLKSDYADLSGRYDSLSAELLAARADIAEIETTVDQILGE